MSDRDLSDRYARIRQALAMGPTPGPWDEIQHEGSRWADIYQDSNRRYATPIVYVPPCRFLDENGIWKESKDETIANAKYVAACDPDTIRELLAERDALRAERDELAEQLRLVTIAEARAEAEANDAAQQRDELLAALRNALPVLEFEVETRGSNDLLYEIPAGPVLDAVRVAIAKAEGKQ